MKKANFVVTLILSSESKIGMITPVPGGVGPMTITMLMEQTYQAALRSAKG